LIAGGLSNAVMGAKTLGVSAYDSAELFDPHTGLFSQTGSMKTARGGHTATLLPDGRILILGGLTEQLSSVAVYYGWLGAAATNTAEIYDSTTGAFDDSGGMSQPRAVHTATLLPNGLVLVTGGIDALSGAVSATAELFDPTDRTFSVTGGLFMARDEQAAALLSDGSVLIVGGDSLGDDLQGTEPEASMELYK
jgi:Galactose oxidase, central domain